MDVRSSLAGNSIDAPTRRAITVVIADDHRLFLEALKTLLEADPGVRVIGEASNGRDAVRLAMELRPDILLLDLLMPTSGLTALRELSKLPSPVRTLLLTAEVGNSDVLEALRLGACGVIMKHTTTELLFKGIYAVMAGQYWVGRECVADLIECMRQRGSPTGAALPGHPTCGLTARQLDIVSAIVAGATNRDIAEQFSISAKTVKYHLTNMFDKLGVSNRIELALFAVQHRLDPTSHQHLSDN